jgi:hypothetical protein
MKNKPQNELRNLANSPDYEDQYDDWYEKSIIRETKNKRKEKDRYAFKEENF